MNKKELKNIFISTESFEDNEYLDKYCELIFQDINTTKNQNGNYTELHHVIPKCIFKYFKLNIKNITVNLLYSKHIQAHFYLACACKSDNKDLFIDIIASIRQFEFIGIKYIDKNKKKFINKNDIFNINLFFKTNFDKMQEIKQKQQFLIKEKEYQKALDYYDKCNRILGKTKDNRKINYHLYLNKCLIYNFVNQGTKILELKRKHFYTLVSILLSYRGSGKQIANETNMKISSCKTRYIGYCNSRKGNNFGYGKKTSEKTKIKLSKARKNTDIIKITIDNFLLVKNQRLAGVVGSKIKEYTFNNVQITPDGIKHGYYRVCKKHPEGL